MSFSAVLEIGLIVVNVLVECVFPFYHCREISSQEEALLVLAMVTVLMAS